MESKSLQFDFDQTFVVFDTESENLNLLPSQNRPWQVSWIVCKGKKVIEEHDYFLKWGNLNVGEGAAKVTGFTTAKYKRRAEDPKPVLDKLFKLLNDKSVVSLGHNVSGFDYYLLKNALYELGKKIDWSFTDRCIDTFSLAKGIYNNTLPAVGEDFLSWMWRQNDVIIKKRGINSIKALCKKYEIEFDDELAHDALYDVKKNFEIFRKQLYDIKNLYFEDGRLLLK